METNQQAPPHVYQAICDVMGDLSELGIAKNQKNQQQGFLYRGIDDVYNTLSKLLAKRRLCILPRVISREMETRTTSGSTPRAIYYVFMQVEFDLVSAQDGSKHTIAAFGEAMDMADKASNKAMSAAYKYACFQAFCIPLEAQDADAETPPDTTPPASKPASKQQQTKPQGSPQSSKPKADTKAATKQSTTKPQLQGPPPPREKLEPLTIEQIADLAVKADNIKAFQEGRNVAAELYNAYLGEAIQLSNTREIAITIISKITDLATKDEFPNLEALINAFTKETFFTEAERTVFLSATRSRLNMAPTTEKAK